MTFCYVQILRELRANKGRANKGQNAVKNRDSIAMSSEEITGTSSVATSSTGDIDFSLTSNAVATPTKVKECDTPETNSELGEKYEDNMEQKEGKKRQEMLTRALPYMVIVLVFVVCWLPFCVTMFWSVYSPTPVPRILDMATLLLGYFNSCCNPFLYGLMNKKLKAAFHQLFCSKCSCGKAKGHSDTSNVKSSSTVS